MARNAPGSRWNPKSGGARRTIIMGDNLRRGLMSTRFLSLLLVAWPALPGQDPLSRAQYPPREQAEKLFPAVPLLGEASGR